MKTSFSSSWLSSKQPRKQRKYRYEAPLHRRHTFLSAMLSKELRAKYGLKSIPLRKGDEVIIMRGKFRSQKGKILAVDLDDAKITIENITRKKSDGSKVGVAIDPSNVRAIALTMDDNKRITKLKQAETQNKPMEKKTNASNQK